MKSEEFLKNLAKQYVEQIGEIYKEENAAITPAPTPGLDRKMQAARRKQKWKTHKRTIMSLAASLIVIVVTGIAALSHFPSNRTHDYVTSDERMQFGVIANDNAPRQEREMAPVPTAPPSTDAAAGAFDSADGMADDILSRSYFMAETEVAEDSHWDAAVAAPATPPLLSVAQVSLTPPSGWQIVYTDFDGDMVIFHLEGETQNSVVVMAAAPPEISDFSEFFPVLINTTWAYMRIESTHSVLIYEQDGMQFTLTTAYDYQDLITLAAAWL